MSFRSKLHDIWNDQVWSNVISGVILALLFSFFGWLWTHPPVLPGPLIGLMEFLVGGASLILSISLAVTVWKHKTERVLLFLSAGGTCRDPMAKAITDKLLATRKLKHRVTVRAAALVELTGRQASYAARFVIKEMYGEDLLSNHEPKKLTRGLIKRADLILVMDKSLLTTPGKTLPPDKTFLLKRFFGLEGDVVDPWPDGKDEKALARYRACADELRRVLTGGFERLVNVLDL